MIIYLGCMLPYTSSNLPEYPIRRYPDEQPEAKQIFLFGLAPDGVYPATSVTRGAVRSYRTISPLLRKAVYFLWHFPCVSTTGRYPASRSVVPGLSSPQNEATICPSIFFKDTISKVDCNNFVILLNSA